MAVLGDRILIVAIIAEAIRHQSDQGPSTTIVGRFAQKRWLWIPPLYALALLVITMVTMTQGTSAAQLVYRRF